jgi:hypothetical protein
MTGGVVRREAALSVEDVAMEGLRRGMKAESAWTPVNSSDRWGGVKVGKMAERPSR